MAAVPDAGGKYDKAIGSSLKPEPFFQHYSIYSLLPASIRKIRFFHPGLYSRNDAPEAWSPSWKRMGSVASRPYQGYF